MYGWVVLREEHIFYTGIHCRGSLNFDIYVFGNIKLVCFKICRNFIQNPKIEKVRTLLFGRTFQNDTFWQKNSE
jgi:hypothetical protein